MSCVWMLQRGHCGNGCILALTLCKYGLRKGDLFVLSWARVGRVMRGSISSGSKRHSLQAVELSQQTKTAVKLCRTFPPPNNGGPIYRYWACRPCGPAGWLALLLTKAGDVEINPGPTTLNKRVWISDICHKQIHVRKQISIRCNRIEHCVHLRCAGIRQTQCTDT